MNFRIERSNVAHINEGMADAKQVAKECFGINIDHITVTTIEKHIAANDFVVAHVFKKESFRGDKAGNGSINIGLLNFGFDVAGRIVNCRLAINQDTCGRFEKSWSKEKVALELSMRNGKEQRPAVHSFNLRFFKQHCDTYLAQEELKIVSKTNGAKTIPFEPYKPM